MLTESCEPRAELRRAIVLAREIEAVHAYEAQAAATPAGSQLAIARSDMAGDLGCWADGDPAFAQLHVRIARDGVADGLKKLPGLASGLAAMPETGVAPAKAAAFRALVRTLADRIEPLCLNSGPDPLLEDARADFDRLRQRLAPNSYGLHFAIAEADAKHVRDRTAVECAEPVRIDNAAAARAQAASEMKDLSARIAAAAGV